MPSNGSKPDSSSTSTSRFVSVTFRGGSTFALSFVSSSTFVFLANNFVSGRPCCIHDCISSARLIDNTSVTGILCSLQYFMWSFSSMLSSIGSLTFTVSCIRKRISESTLPTLPNIASKKSSFLNSCRSGYSCPTPKNSIGRDVTLAIERAAPPLASASLFVNMEQSNLVYL